MVIIEKRIRVVNKSGECNTTKEVDAILKNKDYWKDY